MLRPLVLVFVFRNILVGFFVFFVFFFLAQVSAAEKVTAAKSTSVRVKSGWPSGVIENTVLPGSLGNTKVLCNIYGVAPKRLVHRQDSVH